MARERNSEKCYGTGYEDEPMSRFAVSLLGCCMWLREYLYARTAWAAWFASVYTCCEDLSG
ncbi:Hypothetical Protein CGB_K4540W [Cryptococcus gattii WM276]|uniref:Uncharacterized protein n=1 Tax=Cryptococcus gattii serotype B (strain WM276 / ATCC MYA-4071) TaxID=367775 RepID=E6RE26_CRYGW|nr:Hypothetical Protein CGB_K4540W [Cryptococcus gattii WM276]ADV25051.1 Hypothetical Protein CGB_K4540W [Cryptococcus gattii WM276]